MSKWRGMAWAVGTAVAVVSACGADREFSGAPPAAGGADEPGNGPGDAGEPVQATGGSSPGGTGGTGDTAGNGGGVAGVAGDTALGGAPGSNGEGGDTGSTVSCVPKAGVCDGEQAKVCNDEGNGYVGEGETCESTETCVAGTCEPHECAPSKRFCSASTVRQCAADGLSSEEVATCTTGQYCDAETAQCKAGVCAPDWPACDGTRATVCNATGSGYVAGGTVCSSGQTCDTGECKTHVCQPSQKFCQGQTVKTCAANGLSSTVDSTCTNKACVQSGSTASCVGECAPGQSRCMSNGVQTCGNTGQFGSATACTNKACVQTGTTASCVGSCAPQQKQCSGNGVRTCDATGQFGSVTACAAATPTCSGAGVCGSPRSCNGLATTCGASNNANCCASSVVPGGTFKRSNDSGYPATVSSFRLDNYEVTVARFRRFLAAYSPTMIAAGAGKNPNDPSDAGWQSSWNAELPASATALKDAIKTCGNSDRTNWTDTEGSATNEKRPINCISWFEANAFCIWDGGRLPTETEWNYAAAGGNLQRTYAWGSNAPAANANLAVYGCYYNGSGDCADGVSHDAPVGSVVAGNARWGQSDMTGNVTEWTLDWYESPYPSSVCEDCANHSNSFVRTNRGGSGYDGDGPPLTTTYRGSTGPENHYDTLGVRCARNP